MRDPLLPPLAALAAGIVLARFAGLGGGEAWIAGAAFLLQAVLCRWKGYRRMAATCFCLAVMAGGSLVYWKHRPAPAPELDSAPGEVVVISGCVVEPPAAGGDRERLVLELEPGARAMVTLYAREGEPLPALSYGETVEIESRTRTPRRFGNPGAFDYPRYLARQEIFWTVSAQAASVRRLGTQCGSPLRKAVMGMRAAALSRIERLYPGDPYQSGMMQAILLGQTFQLQKVWTEEYRTTGTFHALVISGTHVAVLAGSLFILLRLCFVPRGAALAATVALAWLYALTTGWQAPCVRSAAGLTLFTIGGLFHRERRILNLLAAVAIGFLLFDPDQLFEPSFQLTFLAVGFIGAFAAPLLQATSAPLVLGLSGVADTARDPRLLPRVAQFRVELRLLAETVRLWTRLPARAAMAAVIVPCRAVLFVYDVVAVSAVVQVGLALPMVAYFHRVGMSGLSANAVVVPLMGLVVPLGFVAVLTGWAWTAQVAGGLLWFSQKVVAWHASIEPAWRIPTPPLWLGLALTAAFVLSAALRGRWRAAAGGGLVLLLGALIWHPFPAQVRAGDLEMTAIDVGQGDSILVAFPDRSLMVVDGGGIAAFGKRARSRMDIGEDVVAPYLWTRSVRRVDVLVLSHAHEDHIGGLAALLDDFHPRELWTGATPDSESWRMLRAKALAAGVAIRALEGPRRMAFGGAVIDVLAPAGGYEPAAAPRNNDSLVMSVRHGRHAFLLAGDVERQMEWRMMEGNAPIRADVLKVAHHGSRTSTSEEFLTSVKPLFAVISAGPENSYGHPHPATVERLERHGARILRTDVDGLVSIRSDGQRLSVDTGRWMDRAAPGLLPPF